MSIKSELDNLKTADIYSLMLFALYKTSELPEYSTLSHLAYILEKDQLLKLCEFYGGLTIKIPTIEELSVLIYALLLYQEVDVEHKDFNECLQKLSTKDVDTDKVEDTYIVVKELLKEYNFNSGRR